MSIKLRDLSKKDFDFSGGLPSNDALQTSSMIRIADAVEAISKPYLKLLSDIEWLEKDRKRLQTENQQLKYSIAGHKAAYTKLKNKHK